MSCSKYVIFNNELLRIYITDDRKTVFTDDEPFIVLFNSGEMIKYDIHQRCFVKYQLSKIELNELISNDFLKEIQETEYLPYYNEASVFGDLKQKLIMNNNGKKLNFNYMGYIKPNQSAKEMPKELFKFIKKILRFDNETKEKWIPDLFELSIISTSDNFTSSDSLNLLEELPFLTNMKSKEMFQKHYDLTNEYYLKVVPLVNKVVIYNSKKYYVNIKHKMKNMSEVNE